MSKDIYILKLSAYLGYIASHSAVEILASNYFKLRKRNLVTHYYILEQCYVLYLHLALREALSKYGIIGRTIIFDNIKPHTFDHIPMHLEAYFGRLEDKDKYLKSLEVGFLSRLDYSDKRYSLFNNFNDIEKELVLNIKNLVKASDVDKEFLKCISSSIRHRGSLIKKLVKDLIEFKNEKIAQYKNMDNQSESRFNNNISNAKKKIQSMLINHQMNQKEIRKIKGFRTIILRKALTDLINENSIQKLGSGKKGDPFVYKKSGSGDP